MTTPKTTDYHHLGMSRDDGMDEHGIDWIYWCQLVGFWVWKLGRWQLRILSHILTTNLTSHDSHL
jgi:hypothetical protein